MSAKAADPQIRRLIGAYVEAKKGTVTEQSNQTLKAYYPNSDTSEEYTYNPALAKEKKIPLIAPGSPTFQRIMHECLTQGILCQVAVKPKPDFEAFLRRRFREGAFACVDCEKVHVGGGVVNVCVKPSPCYHRVNNAKIASIDAVKKEPARYYQFYFSIILQNKLRPKSEEILTLLLDEKYNVIAVGDFGDKNPLDDEALAAEDVKVKLRADVFEKLKATADEHIAGLLRSKLVLYDFQLVRDKKAKLRSYEKRLKRERREQVISKKLALDFDPLKWQANCEALLQREEESYLTHVTVKFLNLLVINTSKVKFEVTLDNHATIQSTITPGVNHDIEVACPVCKKPFAEGFATEDGLYVCGGCIRQSVDTAKIYSKKASLAMDETIREFFESDSGFVCSVCGKKHSRLLEFKCSHDNSSVCINHYDVCDVCGAVFSKLNLTPTDEFRRLLCPKHAKNKKETA
ncbi:MAG: hypothetical protein NWE93_03660 [Candidatus Bathyarchaeota archaeon]|nr:hypothetical protein [Candidatus Bathyarchaeota archaeon]